MDERTEPAYPGGAFGPAEPTGPADQPPAATRQAAAPLPSAPDVRVGDVTVTSDGELFEAGYGHGV